MNNAVKFTKKGFIEIDIDFVESKHNKYSGLLKVTITDTGIGISDDVRSKLFDIFYKADDSFTQKYGGLGLGLPIARSIARSIGGDVTLDRSEEGVGSTFVVTMVVEVQPLQINSQRIVQSGESLKELQALVICETEEVCSLLGRYLETEGATVKYSRDASNIFDVKAKMAGCDFIIIDLSMSLNSGIETANKIRNWGYSHPILALASSPNEADKDICLRNGFNDYLEKQTTKSNLLKTIAKYF